MNNKSDIVLESKIKLLENTLGYCYRDKNFLTLAITHSSFANELKSNKLSSNERIEFLGDAVLNIAISEYIYINYKHLSEGEMTKARASIVCEGSLANCANAMNLSEYLLLGKGEEVSGGRTRVSILSDAFEAIIGSIYLDGGFETAKKFIYKMMTEIIATAIKGDSFVDYKTKLQELAQKKAFNKIQYEIIEEKGPDHDKLFEIQVIIGDVVMGNGTGKSKKEAEQNAAKVAIGRI